jgi:hypothetical protein
MPAHIGDADPKSGSIINSPSSAHHHEPRPAVAMVTAGRGLSLSRYITWLGGVA